MKNLSPAMQAHLDDGTTTLSWCWRISRADGVSLGFTDHDRSLTFAGTEFLAASGFAASEREEEAGLSAATLPRIKDFTVRFRVEKMIMEMALVGPAAIKREEPQRAASTTGSMQA